MLMGSILRGGRKGSQLIFVLLDFFLTFLMRHRGAGVQLWVGPLDNDLPDGPLSSDAAFASYSMVIYICSEYRGCRRGARTPPSSSMVIYICSEYRGRPRGARVPPESRTRWRHVYVG